MKKGRLISSLAIILLMVVAFTFSYPIDTYAYGDYEYYDETYHYSSEDGYEEHDWFSDDYNGDLYDEVIREATLTSDGECIENCSTCGGSRTITYSWSQDEPYSQYNKSYNVIDHSVVYRNSKSITIWLDNAQKGSVVKVKIGKKTYSKKVGSSTKVKIKIKKPKYGSKVSIKVVYKGDVIGKAYYWDDDDEDYYLESDEIVYYAKNIKKGLTKKQVKYLYYWGEPDDVASSSGGWSYWHYDDGSYIGFKKGKVKYWYDAAR